MGMKMKDCDKVSGETLNLESEKPLTGLTAKQIEQANLAQCDQLSVLKGKIENLQNRLVLVEGFKKLKNDLESQKSETSNTDQKISQGAAKKFKENLEIASSLDLLLNTPVSEGESLLQALAKEKPETRSTPDSFRKSLAKVCGKGSELPACTTQISDIAINEINALIAEPITDKKLKEWQSALSIAKKKDGTLWSFSSMYSEMNEGLSKIESKSALSRAEIAVIQALPDFTDAPSGLKFIDDLKTGTPKKLMSNEISKQNFGALLTELQTRQQEQVKNKVSLSWIEFDTSHDFVTDEALKAKCAEAYINYSSAAACVDGLEMMAKGLAPGERQTTLNKLIDNLKSSVKYETHLAGVKTQCASETESCANELHLDEVALLSELQILKKIEERIIKENDKLRTFRNFALEANDSQKCLSKLDINIGECSDELKDMISKEAHSLTIDTMKLTIAMAVEDGTPSDITSMCEDKDEPKFNILYRELCDVKDGKSINKKKEEEKKSGPDINYKVETNPGDNYSPTRAALTQGLASLLGTAANMFSSPVTPYPMYNYMNPMATRPLSISDSIISSAHSQSGYGVYSAVTPSMSRYFSK